ncbi:hypothetical protein H5154_15170 [Pseudoalteromonas sp. SR44-5]|uniref:hypothetical protein n=1 Tax=unclassified Pseudoalteromonas TaxID=194690 RepID=UPI001603B399|nr:MULTISPECIES: hypothetical protein [unclassified Pseudoalteromonas]MBB1335163.1 hypothetical protein [Pseudoalteromonas sp. SR41-6]MBB1342540.1 hypothetical protein [Pseudoalteromonas sp. SR45-6]MBB1367723.1 hypothetical protein [Pseudoalteromonas sp. SR44-5]MBB1419094.1 hypothetical protein [Pseudoalteromonas sp. SG44-1]MBB1422960.1 hypothetical protein [Pseudoalteromonas sp. SG43-7]
MSNKFENIESEEIKLNELGEVELSEELTDAVAGGFSPEEEDEEGDTGCGNTINGSCAAQKEL